MTATSPDTGPGSALRRVEAALEAAGCGPVRRNSARCPAHDDRTPSLSVQQGDKRALIFCHAGCDFEAILAALGLKAADLFDEPAHCKRERKARTENHGRLIATYDYADENGALLFQVLRFEPKDFRQRRPDGTGGWIWKMSGVRLVPYHLDEVVAAVAADDPIFVTEGEKDADAVRALGLVGTCNAGGAGKWRDAHSVHFKSATDVRVVADRDETGYRHAAQVAASLRSVGATVRVLEPADGKDVSDHLAAGHGIEELVELDESRASENLDEYDDAAPTELGNGEGSFFGEGGLIVPKLGEAIRARGHVRLGIDSRLFRYADGVYRPDGDAFVRATTRELLGEKFKRRHLDEVLTYLRADFPSVGDEQPQEFVNVRNGLLDWSTEPPILREHTSEIISTVQLPVAWSPSARCRRIENFLREVLDDAFEFMIEVFGYAMLSANPMRVAVLLLGPGRNGKTVVLNLFKALLGKANVSAVTLQALSENRFMPAELFGKLANICGDLDARAIRQTDAFKMITGGDEIQAERKNKDPFKFTSYALPIFSANEPPLSSDQTEAWFDRWQVVPMEQRIPEHMVDPHLTAKLTTSAELEGLLVLAIEGLRRLMERGRFELPSSVQRGRAMYRERLDTVAAFVAEECELVPEAWTPRATLYRAYARWARDGGRLAVSAATFNDHLRRGFEGKAEERTRRGVRGWAGIWLREGAADA